MTTLTMTEDDLLTAITDALTLYGYRWTHPRRSDKALTMGHPGVPDIIAARKGVIWFIELKSARGHVDVEQFSWHLAIEPGQQREYIRMRVWHPEDLDNALEELR